MKTETLKNEQQQKLCVLLAKELTNSFDKNGLKQMKKDLKTKPALIMVENSKILGFICWENQTLWCNEILWLAVQKNIQGFGVGGKLLDFYEQTVTQTGVTTIKVKTLADTPETKNSVEYVLARKFYEKHGYVLTKIIDPYSGWEPGNPCAVYEKTFLNKN